MTLAASNAFINWHTVSLTPQPSGSAVNLKSVTKVSPGGDGTLEKFKGDAQKFYNAMAVPTLERDIEIETADIVTASGLTRGGVYNVSAILDDMINKAATGGGGATFAWTNAVLFSNSSEGSHAKVGSATLKFSCFAVADADPLTITPL